MAKFCSYCKHDYDNVLYDACPFCGAYNFDNDENFVPVIDCAKCGIQLGVSDNIFDLVKKYYCDDCFAMRTFPNITKFVPNFLAPSEIDDDIPF